jgi:hypothetical protein
MPNGLALENNDWFGPEEYRGFDDGVRGCLGKARISRSQRLASVIAFVAYARIYLRNSSCGRSASGDYDMGCCSETSERFGGCAYRNGLPA